MRKQEMDIDYLAPFLAKIGNPEKLSKQQAFSLKEECLADLKQRLIDKANLIQARFEKVSQLVTIPICQSINHSVSHYVSLSFILSLCQSVNILVTMPVCQLMSHSVSQSVSHYVSLFISHSVDHYVSLSLCLSLSQSICRPVIYLVIIKSVTSSVSQLYIR